MKRFTIYWGTLFRGHYVTGHYQSTGAFLVHIRFLSPSLAADCFSLFA